MIKKLYVGNLGEAIAADDLVELFSQYGEVRTANVVLDRQTGFSRGFGFVEMATPEQADRTMEALNGTRYRGRTIRVSPARQRQQSPRVETGQRFRLRLPFRLVSRGQPQEGDE